MWRYPNFFLVSAILLLACGPKSISKKPVPRENEIRAIRLMAEGDELLSEEKYHLAMLKYMEASDLNPYHEVVFNKLAIVYSRLDRFYEARVAINRAVGLNRQYAYAYNTLGILDMAEKDIEGAAKAFEKAISLQPQVPNFYANLFYAYVKMGLVEKGHDALRRALELDPDIFERGNFIEIGTANPDDPEEFYKLAISFAEINNLSYCLRYLGKALSLDLSNIQRIKSEKAFDGFRDDQKFQSLLRMYGVE
jgi:tetratricopeptide (TPR) repeat protein